MTGCDGIGVLESKHMLNILLFLLENGNSTKMEIYNGVSRNPRMPEKLDALAGLGLITMGSRDNVSDIALTGKGMDVADHLRSIEGIL